MASSTVNISNKQNASEPNTQGAFSIVRTGDLTQPLTVKIDTISVVTLTDTSGSNYATPGEDYQVLPTTVTFAAGQSSLDLPVIPIDDTIPENTQTVKVSIVADPAYTLGTNQTATVLITDNDLVSTIPAGTLKTAAEAGYTIKKLSSSNNTFFHLISGKLVVWQEGTGATSKLQLFDGIETKTLSSETSNVYKSYNSPAFVSGSTRIDNGKVVWGQFVDELLAGYQVPGYHTFLYDGTNTTDLGKTTGAAFAGDRIAWATADGINIYRISDKSNTLVPGAKDVTSLVIDGDKSIVWNENKIGTSLSGVADQTLKFYDGTKTVDLITLAAGKDAYTQPGQIKAAVSGDRVVYTKPGILNAPGDLYLYNNGQSTKIAENVNPTLPFGINGDRVFYQINNTALSAERTYSISSGKTEIPIEYNRSATSFGQGIFNPNTDGKNNTWVSQETILLNPATPFHKDDLYIDDGTTRVDLATSNSTLARLEGFVGTAISGSSVIYNVLTNYSDPTKPATIDLYLASKDSSPTILVNNPPVVANPISAQSIVSGSLLNFSLAANTFTDPDAGDVLTYTAKLDNGGNLPTWLTFDAVTRTFTGTPAAGDVGNFGIVVTATDKAGLTAINSFGLNVTAAIVNPVNNAPVVANPISTQSIVSGSALKFIFAANTFTDPDAGDVLSYSAKLANGNNLPTWLTFDAVTRTFAGTPAAGDIGNLSIAVTATDKAGLTVASNFGLSITGVVPPTSGGLIAGLTIANNLFSTDAFLKGFGITAISQKPTTKANEIGIFAVDDLSGKVNGIAVGAVGYTKAVLDAAKPIFSTLGGNFFSSSKQEFAIDPNKIYEFFEIQDGSIVDLKQQIAVGKTPTNIRYSFLDASGNSPFKITSNSKNDGYQISVNTDELVLDLVKLAGSSVNFPIGTKSQTAPEGRTIDFTDYVGKTLKVDITTKSDAAYDNNIGFYAVEDSDGSIKLANGSLVKPGADNYAIEAIKNALTNSQLQAGKNDSKLDRLISGGKTYAPVIVAQGTLNDFVSKNPTNGGDGSAIHAYFNYLGANPDKLDHFRLVGNNTFGVEDLYGGGDRDFNDLIVNFNVKSVA